MDVAIEVEVFVLLLPLLQLLLQQLLLLLLRLFVVLTSTVIQGLVSLLHYCILLYHLLDNCEVSASNFLLEIPLIELGHCMSPSLNNGARRKGSRVNVVDSCGLLVNWLHINGFRSFFVFSRTPSLLK